jgi:hypothetical protein
MQTKSTIDQLGPARLLGIFASMLVATVLVVGFVVASLGVGSEGQIHLGPMTAPVVQFAPR